MRIQGRKQLASFLKIDHRKQQTHVVTLYSTATPQRDQRKKFTKPIKLQNLCEGNAKPFLKVNLPRSLEQYLS